ncbi:MAG: glycine C-acetyltransferase [Bacteroidetes bacterium]|nr:glycine C-acetyltransferase [Bacteroidota bacterium]
MKYLNLLVDEIQRIHDANTYKFETAFSSPQAGTVNVKGKNVVMMASNNYLGMSNHPVVKKAAIEAIKEYGYGMASVRFICGTQTIHLELEKKISKFVGTEATILFSSAFAANNAFFPSLLNEKLGYETYRDVIYTDALNHASIIDGMRLCKTETTDKKIYRHNDVTHLEELLHADINADYRFKIIATDGVFSMEGDLAHIDTLAALAQKYNAVLFVDDCHAIGVVGKSGRGTPEYFKVHGKVDVLSGTLGKAIGGALGGYVSGKKELIEYLRQKARPYTFSNSLPPPVVMASIAAFDLLMKDRSIVKRLHDNTAYFRKEIKALGFHILEGDHPIVPVMLGDASLAQEMSKALLKDGVYVKGLWFPVVPKGEARLRVQISAALSKKDLDRALNAFESVGRKMNVLS